MGIGISPVISDIWNNVAFKLTVFFLSSVSSLIFSYKSVLCRFQGLEFKNLRAMSSQMFKWKAQIGRGFLFLEEHISFHESYFLQKNVYMCYPQNSIHHSREWLELLKSILEPLGVQESQVTQLCCKEKYQKACIPAAWNIVATCGPACMNFIGRITEKKDVQG